MLISRDEFFCTVLQFLVHSENYTHWNKFFSCRECAQMKGHIKFLKWYICVRQNYDISFSPIENSLNNLRLGP